MDLKERHARQHRCVSSKCIINDLLWFVNKIVELVHNTAAQVLTRNRKRDHSSPVLASLRWLPVKFRDFQILLLTYTAVLSKHRFTCSSYGSQKWPKWAKGFSPQSGSGRQTQHQCLKPEFLTRLIRQGSVAAPSSVRIDRGHTFDLTLCCFHVAYS